MNQFLKTYTQQIKNQGSDQVPLENLLGAEIIIKAFINEGVDIIFGYPGGAILPFYDALFLQNKLHHILTRH